MIIRRNNIFANVHGRDPRRRVFNDLNDRRYSQKTVDKYGKLMGDKANKNSLALVKKGANAAARS